MQKEWASEDIKRDEKDYRPDMPPLENEYLIDYLFDVGPIVNTGMGGIALRIEHIRPWQQETGVRLSVWESRTLRRLSSEYLNEQHRATKIGCEPPWKVPGRKPEKTALQLSIMNFDKT